ncbi:MAG: FG-GAP-like repeat-containing protein [Candidatus Acidiferrales bacterium]
MLTPRFARKHHPLARVASVVLAWAVIFAAVGLTARAQSASRSGQQAEYSTPVVGLAPAAKPNPKKAKEAYRRALHAEQVQDWQTAYDDYAEAVSLAPNVREYFLMREMAKSRLVQIKVNTAERDAVNGRIDEAVKELRDASYLDPLNGVVRVRIAELTAGKRTPIRQREERSLAGEVRLDCQPGKQNFDYRGDTKGAYEELARKFAVEVAFDEDMISRQVRIQVTGVDFFTAARLLGDATGTFWRPLTPHLFFVTDNTPQKRRDYEPSLVRTVLLPAAETPDDMTEMFRVVREIAGVTRSSLNSGSRTITLRADPQAIAVASKLIRDLEQPASEMVLEFEVLEVDRSYARDLGIVPPQTSQAFSLNQQQIQEVEAGGTSLVNVINQIFGLPSSVSGLSPTQIGSLLGAGQLGLGSLIPPLVAFGGGDSTFLATMPGITANFSEMLSLVKTGDRVLLRAQDGQPSTFFVGDRIPVSLASFSSSEEGTGGTVPGVSTASFPTTNYAVGKSPSAIVSANFHDLSSTSTLDLAVANETDGTISVLQGNGDGAFQTPVTVQLPAGFEPTAMAAYDFNGDGHEDLVVTSTNATGTDGNLSILLGNGDGTFQPSINAPTGNLPVSVAVANFHNAIGGNSVDVAVSNQNDNSISIFQINSDGTFSTSSSSPSLIQLPAGYKPAGLATGTFTNSGHIDLAVADEGNDTVSVFLGNGDGTFQTRTDYATGNSPIFVATGDFNGDGVSDLAIANYGAPTSANTGNTVTVLLGQKNINDASVGNGQFAPGTERDFPAGNGPTSIAVGDFNIDGMEDLVVSDQADNAVSVLLGLGSGLFGPNFELPVDQAPVSITSGDFNAAGTPDIATANHDSNDATVILNSSSFTGAGNPLSSSIFPGVEYLDIGLKIKATPRVHPDGDVTLTLNFENSSLAGQSLNSIPVINNQSVDQTVRVKEGKTAILAGFLQTQTTNALNGLPGLGQLPGVQWLSSNQNAQNQRTELLILVTPRMVRLAPRKDQTIYAGQGSSEGQVGGFTRGGFAPAREFPPRPEPPPAGTSNLPGFPRQPQIPPGQNLPPRQNQSH